MAAVSPLRPDPYGKDPVVFDATIPDHFALSTAMELLEKRYGGCTSYMPEQVRDELNRATSKLPALRDALSATWLLDHHVSLDELVVIEQMREAAFGEADPLRGLGECVVIHMAQTMTLRAGIDDRVARRMAKARKVRVFGALDVIQAIYRYCGITKGDARDLYHRLLNGTGRKGTSLTSMEVMGDTKLEKHLSSDGESFA